MIIHLQRKSYERARAVLLGRGEAAGDYPSWDDGGWLSGAYRGLVSRAMFPDVGAPPGEKAEDLLRRTVVDARAVGTTGLVRAHVVLPALVSDPFTGDARLDLGAVEDCAFRLSRTFPTGARSMTVVGVTGAADALVMLGLRYDSAAGVRAFADACYSAARGAWLGCAALEPCIPRGGEDKLKRFVASASRRGDSGVVHELEGAAGLRSTCATTPDPPYPDACEIHNFVTPGHGPLSPQRSWEDRTDRRTYSFGYAYLEFVRWFYEVRSGVDLSGEGFPEFAERCWSIDPGLFGELSAGAGPGDGGETEWLYNTVVRDLL